jgi:hypothetical protein
VGVKGRLKDMSLVDVVQIFNAENKTAAIHLGSENGYARVYICEGKIVHAVYRELTGTEALFQLLGWTDGEFEVETDMMPPERTIDAPTEALLLEGMRRLDEASVKGADSEAYVGDLESIRLINDLLEQGILEKAE